MATQRLLKKTLFPLFSWGLLGATFGLGASYLIYVKKPALFQSSAVVQVSQVSSKNTESSSGGMNNFVSDTEDADRFDGKEAEEEVDDRLLLQSEAVLIEAVKLGELSRLPDVSKGSGARGREPSQIANNILSSGRLRVFRLPPSSLGAVYEISFRAALPSSSQRVVAAIVSSSKSYLSNANDGQTWSESLRLLGTTRQEIDVQIQQIQQNMAELELSPRAMLRDGKVESAEAQQWESTRTEVRRLKSEQLAIEEKLRRTESLIAEGASTESILVSLDQTLRIGQPFELQSRSADNDVSAAEEEHRQWLELRARLTAEVDRAVAPLQRELDSLLAKVGPKHITVIHVRSKIAKARARLNELPPEPGRGSVASRSSSDSPTTNAIDGLVADGDALSDSQSRQIPSLLRALRSQRDFVESRLAILTSELLALASEVSEQEVGLRNREMLQRELDQQIALRDSVIEKLEVLGDSSPEACRSLTVLTQPQPGVQVEPSLQGHLFIGGVMGLLAGTVLSCLMFLSSTVTQGESAANVGS